VKYWVGVTDNHWFQFLAEKRPDEVNFWRPKNTNQFRAIQEGALFLFKLHSPYNYIAGGAFFLRHTILPLPDREDWLPNKEYLEWHNAKVFVA
jgi:putative restriction endonuclease